MKLAEVARRLGCLLEGEPEIEIRSVAGIEHAIELFYQPLRYAPGIHPTAVIAKSASIGEGSHIGPYCFIDEEATVGRNAVLHSFVTIYRGVKVGDSFFAHAHAVV